MNVAVLLTILCSAFLFLVFLIVVWNRRSPHRRDVVRVDEEGLSLGIVCPPPPGTRTTHQVALSENALGLRTRQNGPVAHIVQVIPDSDAYRAGLYPGRLVSAAGETVTTKEGFRAIVERLRAEKQPTFTIEIESVGLPDTVPGLPVSPPASPPPPSTSRSSGRTPPPASISPPRSRKQQRMAREGQESELQELRAELEKKKAQLDEKDAMVMKLLKENFELKERHQAHAAAHPSAPEPSAPALEEGGVALPAELHDIQVAE